ncbi:Protein CBG18718 [Caenorhabditis briggsae]|uniref:Protein CBG18718 n=1 Tax=Caenorhabditis briggsae TaxID=6238 RepID=A8XTZ3_CAEBR|nr:Protein CBG18718 [Caenorhabditis briggsae]CAP36119.2 Protein CBG18718 [Caenorhabditis briggsae]
MIGLRGVGWFKTFNIKRRAEIRRFESVSSSATLTSKTSNRCNLSDEEMGPLDLMHMLREIRNKEKRINRTLDSFKANVNDTLIQSQSIEAVRLSTELCFRMAGLILDSNDPFTDF